jgi:mRNA (guanine-N7-)-methyltransferase
MQDPIRARLAPDHPLFDVVSMQFVMHYSFESEEKARTMLLNVSKNLRRGGYFIGTIPSSDAIIEGIQSLGEDEKEFGNELYKVRFPERPTQTVFRPPYGHRYNFFMEDAVENVPEYIVPFEVFRGYAILQSRSNLKTCGGCKP